ncbi:MAG: ABC transporter ATP-binding protein [Acholeplasmatales bacterium]|nr:MAG: ABC transporter ATP-binding protein [Acholeplasmatales bacterium]
MKKSSQNTEHLPEYETPSAGEVLLNIEELHVSYGPILALRGVSLQVKSGSIVAILGSNGAGKTTLLKKVSGLIPATAGSVTFDGENITKLPPEKITKKGIVQSPEGRRLFSDLTVLENLMIGAFTIEKGQVKIGDLYEEAKTKRIKKLIDAAANSGRDIPLEDIEITLKPQEMMRQNLQMVYRLFPVLEERKHQVSATLSGGEQQMLAIGRALMRTPKLLVLDEPSLGLAPLIVKSIFEIIRRLNEQGITVLIVEQNALQTLSIADYAYVLRLGKVVREGPAALLKKDKSLVEAYLGK